MKSSLRNIIAIFLLIFVSSLSNAYCQYDYVFKGDSNGEGYWNVASNWEPEGVPYGSDSYKAVNVLIPSGTKATINDWGGYLYHNITVKGTLVIFEGRTTGPIVVDGGNLICNSGLSITQIGANGSEANGNSGHLDIIGNGTVTINGTLSCGQLTVAQGCNLSTKGANIRDDNGSEGKGKIDISGSAQFDGYVRLGDLAVNSGANIVFKGDVNLGDGNGDLKIDGGNVEFEKQLNFGKLTIVDENNPNNSMVVDVDKILMNGWGQPENHPALKQVITDIENKLLIVRDIWTGNNGTSWYDEKNWENGKIPTNKSIITIPSSVYNDNYPIIKKRVDGGVTQTAIARSIFLKESATLTIEDGGSAYFGKIYTDKTYDGSRIVINNKCDISAKTVEKCSLRLYDGVILREVNEQNDEVFNKLTINTELLTGVTYYIGSAVTDRTFEQDNTMYHLNDDAKSAGKRDEIYGYNPVGQDYSMTYPLSEIKGGSVYLYWREIDGGSIVSKRTLTQRGTIRKQNDAIREDLQLKDGEEFGWNILSNPYLFAFNLTDYENQFEMSDDIQFVMFRRYKGGKYESVAYSFGTGVALPKDATTLSGDLYIAPQQGFFLKAKQAGSYFGFVPSKVPTSGVNALGATSLKSAKFVNDVLYLSLNSSVSSKAEDQTALVFRQGGTLSANDIDADKKFESGNNLYLLKDAREYAIGLYPEVKEVGDELLPLGFIAAKGATQASIKAVNLDEFNEDVDVYLCDLWTKEMVDLRNAGNYTFDIDAATQSGVRIEDRFAIVLKSNSNESGIATGVKEEQKAVVTISAGQDAINVGVVGLEGNADVCVYDMMGRVVSRTTVQQGINTIDVSNKGIYLVDVVAVNVKEKGKVVVSK